ncbi:MAG TPA: LamG-like jellyroll fold domain-containing protein [Gemmatimonadaceae bacterium]|nr:LamG-like jellyroll fold domain-containing protein [Gemmatimonadaceae bacterium]
MTYELIIATPLLVLLILAVFRFTGCSSFSSAPTPPTTVTGPPLVIAPPDTPPPVPTDTYQDIISKTPGFAALWPLNEMSGTNQAKVVGPLAGMADGTYTARPPATPGTGYSVGVSGLQFPKVMDDRAGAFDGSVAFIEVQFNPILNPSKTVPGFTVELWAKPNPAVGGPTQVLVSSHRFDSAGVQQGYEIALIKGGQQIQQVRGRVFANGAMGTATVQALAGGAADWRHIVLTWELSQTLGPIVSVQVRLAGQGTFKDGPHGGPYEAVTAAKPSSLWFAAGHGVGQVPENLYYGVIDNVAFYNGVLSQAEIDKHFALLTP